MTACRRAFQPGGCHFFTVVTEQRRPLLIDNIDRLRRAFRIGIERRPVNIDAIVVLPDHLHTLWRLPEGDTDFSTRWMHIKRCFSAGLQAPGISSSKQRKREKGIWQRRFREHLIRDEADRRRHMDYIHYNPVKHGYCVAPADGLYAPDGGHEMPMNLQGVDWE